MRTIETTPRLRAADAASIGRELRADYDDFQAVLTQGVREAVSRGCNEQEAETRVEPMRRRLEARYSAQRALVTAWMYGGIEEPPYWPVPSLDDCLDALAPLFARLNRGAA